MKTADPRLAALLDDLAQLGDQLEAAVSPLDEIGWRRPTPAAGWDVATTIGHLAWTDEAAVAAIRAGTDPDGKSAWDALVLIAIADPEHIVDKTAAAAAAAPPAELLGRWDESRRGLVRALAGVPAGVKLPWFGPPMSALSMATARFMETWAHGLDVYDALGVTVEHGEELQHIAHLGVRTRDFAFRSRELAAPTEEFRIELTAPSGEVWTFGPEHAAQQVTGSALDFCQLVTQRAHRDDTSLVARGADAERWLEIAQCFAGPSGGGREPGAR